MKLSMLNKSNIKLISVFIISSFILLIASFSYYESTYDIKQYNEKLICSYNELVDSYNDLLDEYEYLESKHDDLNLEIKKYKDQQETVDNLTTQLSELQSQFDALKTENDSLTSQVASLQTNNSSGGNGGRLPSTTSNSLSSNSVGGMVWLSETGSKYHSIPNCGRMNPNNAWQVSQSSAEASGYGRCSKCF